MSERAGILRRPRHDGSCDGVRHSRLGQPDHELATGAGPLTVGRNTAAVMLDKIPHDRQTKAKAAL